MICCFSLFYFFVKDKKQFEDITELLIDKFKNEIYY